MRPRKPFPPQPLDKYQLRETKRRLLQSLGGRLSPWACAHSSPLHQNPFCGEHGAAPILSACLPQNPHSRGPPTPGLPSCPAPGQPHGVENGLTRTSLSPALAHRITPSLPFPHLHSCLPAPAPPALWRRLRDSAPLGPVAAAAPALGAPPEAQAPPAPAGPHFSCSPCCPSVPAPVGRLWSPLLSAGRGPGGPGPCPPPPLDPPAGLALGPAVRTALRVARGPEPGGPGPTRHCHPQPRPRPAPWPPPHPQAGPGLCPLLPTQAPAAGGQPWLHRPGCQQ